MKRVFSVLLFFLTFCASNSLSSPPPASAVDNPIIVNGPAILEAKAKPKAAKVNKITEPVLLEVVTFDKPSIDAIIEQLKAWDAGGAPEVWIRLDTNGGSVDEGFRLIKQIEGMKSKTVCLADIKAYSMGFAVLQACDVRAMTKRSALMVHEVIFMKLGASNAGQLREYAKQLDMYSKQMRDHNLRRLKITAKEYLAKTTDKEWYFTWEEALKIGAVDKVVDPKDVPSLTEVAKKKSLADFLLDL